MTDVVDNGRFIDDTGEGETVVLLHSSGLSGRQFRKLAQTLVAADFHVLAPDLAGHGRSPAVPEPTPLSFHDDVEWLVELVRTRGPAHLVGHSYGAFIALQAALELGESVHTLVLFEPVAFGVLEPEARVEIAAADGGWGSTSEEHDRWLQGFVDYWDRPGAWAGQREQLRAEFRRVGWAVYQGVRTLAVDPTAASEYAGLTMPVTLMTAERSPAAARGVARTLAATIPGARLVEVAGAGHMAPLTHADEVNAAVVAALGRPR